MRYAKLIDGVLRFAPNPIVVGGRVIGNPPGSVYEFEGYKPVRYTEPPIVAEGYVAVPGWSETDSEIVQTWTIEFEPITDEDALIRYSNELTGANDETLEEATETLIKIVKEAN